METLGSEGLAIYSQRLKQKNPKVMEETYQYYATAFSFPPRVSHEGLRHAMEMIGKGSAGAKVEGSVDKFLDESLLDELEREGFFKRLTGGG